MRPITVILLLFVVYACASSARLKRSAVRTKVLILGAGVAGLNAAKHLTDAGFHDFLILEGEGRVGGRFKQAEVGGAMIEEGANWVHHVTDDNPIWKLVQKNEKGKDVTNKTAINHFYSSLEKASELAHQRRQQQKPDMSLRVGLAQVGWKPKNPVDDVVEYHGVDFEYPDKPELDSFSAEVRGRDFFVLDSRGYGHIWQEMAKEFMDKIILNAVVREIRYSNYGVTVTTTDGRTYSGRYSLCTFSTGVLATDMVNFSPPLPEWKMESIYKVPMRYYTKIFLQFPTDFWDDNEFILYAHKNRGHYPIWMDIDRPGLAPGSKILHVTVTGDEALRVEGQSDEETKAEIMRELRKVYGSDIPEPIDFFYSRWSRNNFTRGSFPNVMIGTTKEDFHNLQGNVKSLYFAGDATEYEWWGFVQSAYLSGRRKATEILKCLQQTCDIFHPMSNVVQGVYIQYW
ncbi:predicted protein [Nematostella vectensis]|uniref:Amine oxidase domain-containing protein n=1 Tax=Nematostella vectensis TaxID=45351 RepID=A7RTH2_NEMVE|nr:predicted protein [Nematostella vectensis]|eukprot:XP_001637277.1 predicted protein [Nematostella vectensis]